jgi:hypothetical protein
MAINSLEGSYGCRDEIFQFQNEFTAFAWLDVFFEQARIDLVFSTKPLLKTRSALAGVIDRALA